MTVSSVAGGGVKFYALELVVRRTVVKEGNQLLTPYPLGVYVGVMSESQQCCHGTSGRGSGVGAEQPEGAAQGALAPHSDPSNADAPGYVESGSKARQVTRLRKIEGQIRGIERMVAQDRYCIDILTQISAATRALQSLSLTLLEDHMNHCMVTAARQSDEAAAAKVAEATKAIERLIR